MGIGTIDRTPPPFFRQGLSALTKLILCSALALFLMVADNRFTLTRQLRAVVATALYYPQQVLLVPVQAIAGGAGYLIGLRQAQADEEAARRQLTRQSERALRVEQLLQENARLRALLELRPTLDVRSQAAQVLYEASDPYSRKVVIDRGMTSGVVIASPVINEGGVLGQVTRVFPLSSEVTLLVDKDAAIPVLNTRTGVRSAAFGSASVVGGAMEMRFMAGNADVRPGDALSTSGVDGIYPPGLPVATVASVDRKADSGFARIVLRPVAHPDGVRHVLVLEPVAAQMPSRADAAPPDEPRPASAAASGKKSSRTAPAEAAGRSGLAASAVGASALATAAGSMTPSASTSGSRSISRPLSTSPPPAASQTAASVAPTARSAVPTLAAAAAATTATAAAAALTQSRKTAGTPAHSASGATAAASAAIPAIAAARKPAVPAPRPASAAASETRARTAASGAAARVPAATRATTSPPPASRPAASHATAYPGSGPASGALRRPLSPTLPRPAGSHP